MGRASYTGWDLSPRIFQNMPLHDKLSTPKGSDCIYLLPLLSHNIVNSKSMGLESRPVKTHFLNHHVEHGSMYKKDIRHDQSDNISRIVFLDGNEASKYNFGTRLFRAVLMSWVQEVVDAEIVTANAGAALTARTSTSSSSSGTAGMNSGQQDSTVSSTNSVGRCGLAQTVDLDEISRFSSEKRGFSGRVRELQPGLRMMSPGRIAFLSNFARMELDLHRYRATWSDNYFVSLGNPSDTALKTFPEAGLYARVRELPVFKDNDKLFRFLKFDFDQTKTGCLSLVDFCSDEPWVFDLGEDNRKVRTVSAKFKVYMGRCLSGFVDSLVLVNGTEYEPLRAVCSEPYSGYGVVANYPDVYLFVLYHQLLVSMGRLLNDVAGTVEDPLHGPEYIVPIFVKKFKDLNNFVDVEKLPLALFEANVLPFYSFVAVPVEKHVKRREERVEIGGREGSVRPSKKQKNGSLSRGAVKLSDGIEEADAWPEGEEEEDTPLLGKELTKRVGEEFCAFALCGLVGVVDDLSGQAVECRGKNCRRFHAGSSDAVTNEEARSSFDALIQKFPAMKFLRVARDIYLARV